MKLSGYLSVCLLAALPATATSQSLTTLFAANNGGAAGWCNYFDLTVNVGIDISQFDVNVNAAAGTIGGINVYIGTLGSTYFGNELTGLGGGTWPAAPTASSSATIASLGLDVPTPCPIPTFTLTPGVYPVMIEFVGAFAPAYTNGNFTYSNSEVQIDTGSASSALSGGTLFNPRSWNGAVHYAIRGGFATASTYGDGCGGTAPRSAYELFDPANNPNDMSNSSWAMIYTGNPSEPYIFVPTALAGAITPPTGAPAVFLDDDNQMVTLPFSMPFETGATNTIYVDSNGFLSPVALPGNNCCESYFDMTTGPLRVAGLWDDFDPSAATGFGTIHMEADPAFPTSRFHITWTNVTQFIAVAGGGSGVQDSNTFQITLDSTGTIEVNYGALGTTDGMIGYSPGGGVVDPGNIDFSALTSYTVGTGIPSLTLTPGARPILGGPPATATLSEIPGAANGLFGSYLLGLTPFNPGIDLTLIGMDGCSLYTDGGLGGINFVVNGTTDSSLSVPITGNVLGLHVFVQAVVLSPGTNPLGVVTSNGLDWGIEGM